MLGRSVRTFAAFLRARAVGVGLPERLVLYGLIWWVLAEGEVASLYWGAPAVVAAALFNPFPPDGRRAWGIGQLVGFIPVFAYFSVRSALSVARRLLRRRPDLAPEILELHWRLEGRSARLFMAHVINLMPGSLTVGVGERALVVHILWDRARTVAGLRRLEGRVAALYGESIDEEIEHG